MSIYTKKPVLTIESFILALCTAIVVFLGMMYYNFSNSIVSVKLQKQQTFVLSKNTLYAITVQNYDVDSLKQLQSASVKPLSQDDILKLIKENQKQEVRVEQQQQPTPSIQ